MNHRIHTNNRQSGAAMMGIVLIIVVILIAMVGALSIGPQLQRITYERQTVKRANAIVDAMRQYYLARGELPEPGSVPVTALNLEQKNKFDAWGQEWCYYRATQTVGGEQITDITGVVVDTGTGSGLQVAGVLISSGPNQNFDSSRTVGVTESDIASCNDLPDDGSIGTITKVGDDIVIPLNVQAEAIQIAKDELGVLARGGRGCPLDDRGAVPDQGIIRYVEWDDPSSGFLGHYGLSESYKFDPWTEDSGNREYYWYPVSGLERGYWVSLGPDGQQIRSTFVDCTDPAHITALNFSTMTGAEITSFIADAVSPHSGNWKPVTENEYDVTDDVVLGNPTQPPFGAQGFIIYVPIPDRCDKYIIRSVARATFEGAGGQGYGVFFDTKLNHQFWPFPGYILQFDNLRGGSLNIRERVRSGESEPVFEYTTGLPVMGDPWWQDLHYIETNVTYSSTVADSRYATFKVYDMADDYTYHRNTFTNFSDTSVWTESHNFDYTYSFDPRGDQLYTGFRTWGNYSFFHYLGIETLCSPVIVVRNNITLQNSSMIQGDSRAVGGNVSLASSTELDGDLKVRTGATVNGSETITGNIFEINTPYTYCSYEPYTSGCGCTFPSDCTSPSSGTIGIGGPNCFDDINVNSTLDIEVGDRDRVILVGTLQTSGSGAIRVVNAPGTSGQGRLFIYVHDAMNIGGSSTVNNRDAERLIIFSRSDADFSGTSRYRGALFAPDAAVTLSNSAEVSGFIEAYSLECRDSARLMSDYSNTFRFYCGLIAEYLFDNSGTIGLDTSGYDRHGTVETGTGATATAPQAYTDSGYSTCSYGTFNGSDSGVNVDSVDLGLGDQLTVMAWVRWGINPSTGSNWANIITSSNAGSGSGDVGQFWLQHDQHNSRYQFAVSANNRHSVDSTTGTLQGTWQHVTGVYDGLSVRIYVNGRLENVRELNGTVTPHDSDFELNIGRWGRPANQYRRFNGNIDEVRIFNRALNEDEIKGWMNTTRTCD